MTDHPSSHAGIPVPERVCPLSLFLRALIILSVFFGVLLTSVLGSNEFQSAGQHFMFFTIQSNIAIGLICAWGFYKLLKKEPAGRLFSVIQFMGTLSITLTGVVFCAVLAPFYGPDVWNIWNFLTHVLVPLASVLDFFLTGPFGDFKKSDIFYTILPPIAYAIYAGIVYLTGGEFFEGIPYPYFFLNWGSPAGVFGFSSEPAYIGVAWWILILCLSLLLVARLYLFVVDRLKDRSERS